MPKEALNLLLKERVCILAVTLPDGSPHVAAVHYSQILKPVKLFIQTYPTVKTGALQENGGEGKAAVVIGTSEKDFVSLQMRGVVRVVTDTNELENIYTLHYAKHPDAKKYLSDTTIFLEFLPTWWRYSDFNTDPETIIESK